MSNKIIIRKRKLPTVLGTVICLLIGPICMFVVLYPEGDMNYRIGSFVAALIFLLGAIWGISELTYTNAGIEISKEGICDNSTRMACGFVPWTNVKKILVISSKGHCYGSFILNDPKQVLAQSPGWLARFLNTLNHYNFASPVRINLQGFKIKRDDLINLLYAAYGKEDGIEFQ
ncbi:MAG: STM3941 family protein [Thermoguttaceae bacterium]